MNASRLLLGCLLLSAAFVSVSAQEEKKGTPKAGAIAGVKGTVYVIDGNKNKETKVTAKVQDLIVIEWTFPIVPPFPKSAQQKSSDDTVVKTAGIHHVVNVKGPIGVGHLGARFTAVNKGEATVTLTVNDGKDDVTMTCKVTVE
jgi:hypothetical protein